MEGLWEKTDFDLAKLQIFHLHWLEWSCWVKRNLTEPLARIAGYERQQVTHSIVQTVALSGWEGRSMTPARSKLLEHCFQSFYLSCRVAASRYTRVLLFPPLPILTGSHLNNYVHTWGWSVMWGSFTWGSYNGFRELVPIAFLEIYCSGPNLQGKKG